MRDRVNYYFFLKEPHDRLGGLLLTNLEKQRTRMNTQAFNSKAKEHILSVLNTIQNQDLETLWDGEKTRTVVEIDNHSFEFAFSGSFYGDDSDSIYLSLEFYSTKNADTPPHHRNKRLGEFNLSKSNATSSPSLYIRTAESMQWHEPQINEDNSIEFNESSLADIKYSLVVKTVEAQFTQTLTDAFPALAKQMSEAQKILIEREKEQKAQAEIRREQADKAFKLFAKSYRTATTEESEELLKSLEEKGSVEFTVIMRGKPKEIPITIIKTEDGYNRVMKGTSRPTQELNVLTYISQAKFKLS